MKCPNCGKWNQANFPHCVYCGQQLSAPVGDAPVWQKELDDRSKAKAYLRVDESGEIETEIDARDALAADMADLKKRKAMGETQQRRLRERVSSQTGPEDRGTRTVSNREVFFADARGTEAPLRPRQELAQEDTVSSRPLNPPRYRTVYSMQNGEERVLSPVSEERPVYDSYRDTSAYYRDYGDSIRYQRSLPDAPGKRARPRISRGRRILRTAGIIIAVFIVAVLGGYLGYEILTRDRGDEVQSATVMMTIDEDGLTAHTVSIPGEDGQRITIRELRTSAIVTGGAATFNISDHLWYDDYTDYLQETMRVTLSPYLVGDNGRQTALEQIHYDIDIPLSPIELDTPNAPYQVVSTALYNIVFYVQEGSSVSINGEDYSDLVNSSGGKVSYNATVQPIGENEINIVVRSQYCRENTLTVILYREKQEIPLDLATDIATSTSTASGSITVRGTTLPGAVVKVLSPHRDLDITNTAIDGSFSFTAKLENIGQNVIVITSDYPGKQTTRVEHIVNYVPNIDIYSRKAWDIVTGYTDLMDNIEVRKAASQIYVCRGVVTSVDTTKPQRCFMNVGTEEDPLSVYIENSSKTVWEVGVKYRVFGDVFGMYDGKPWLVVRYTYKEEK